MKYGNGRSAVDSSSCASSPNQLTSFNSLFPSNGNHIGFILMCWKADSSSIYHCVAPIAILSKFRSHHDFNDFCSDFTLRYFEMRGKSWLHIKQLKPCNSLWLLLFLEKYFKSTANLFLIRKAPDLITDFKFTKLPFPVRQHKKIARKRSLTAASRSSPPTRHLRHNIATNNRRELQWLGWLDRSHSQVPV